MLLSKLDSTQLPNASIRIMLTMLEANGFATDDALKSAKIGRDRILQPNGLVTAREELEFQRAFVGLTRAHPRPQQLWVDLGRHYHCVSFGSFGSAWLTSATVEDVYKLICDLQELYYGTNATKLLFNGPSVVGVQFVDQGIPDDLKEFTMCWVVTCATEVFYDLCPNGPALEHVEIEFDVSSASFKRPTAVNAERTALHWSKETARRAIPSSDAVLHRMYVDDCKYLRGDDDLVTLIARSLLARALTGRPCQVSIDTLACEAGLSRRTFQRRLSKQGSCARDLTGRAQQKAAEQMLRTGGLSLNEVAFKMGYTEVSAFSRAFRRWTGVSPGHYRSQLAGA
jgi:AraC-like DNA-binding protein